MPANRKVSPPRALEPTSTACAFFENNLRRATLEHEAGRVAKTTAAKMGSRCGTESRSEQTVTSCDNGAGLSDVPPGNAPVPTLPFIPSAVEMHVLRQIESGQASLPVLPGSSAGANEGQVRVARASLGGA